MFGLRFINVAADDTYCMAAAKVTRNLLAAEYVRGERVRLTATSSFFKLVMRDDC
jgi:hypothetical protein